MNLKILFLSISMVFVFTACSGGGGGGGSSSSGRSASPSASLCTDTNASNVGSSLPCSCNSGYTLSSDGTTCTAPSAQSYSYTPTFSSYLPLQASTTPCQGTVTTTRSILTCLRSDNVSVATSLCTDPNPTSTVLSIGGTATITPTNGFTNGTLTMTCGVGQTTGAQYHTCNANYHLLGSTFATENCYSNTQSCSSLPTGATAGTQTWTGSGWGSCTISSCDATNKYILSSNSCVKCAADQIIQGGACVTNVTSDLLLFLNTSTFHVRSTNALASWGNNANYQLGQGGGANQVSPVAVNFSSKTVKRVFTDAYNTSTCAVLNDDSLSCWGLNSSYQLGNNTTTTSTTPVALTMANSSGVRTLVSSGYNYCAIMGDQSLECWGENAVGQLGNGTTSSVKVPTQVSFPGGITVQKVIMTKGSNATTCALMSDSSVYCWGYNSHGQVGVNDSITQTFNTPQKVTLGANASDIVAIEDQSYVVPTSINYLAAICATLSTGSLKCWGANQANAVGDGTSTDRFLPISITIPGGKSVSQVYPMQNFSACALLTDSSVACWGANYYGIVGNGSASAQASPVAISMPSSLGVQKIFNSIVTSLTTAPSACALLSNNSVACWGANTSGQLGVGSLSSYIYSPTLVTTVGSKSVSSVFLSDTNSCLIATDGSVQCTGLNSVGQLGQGTTSTTASTTYQAVNLGTGVTATEVKVSRGGACVLTNSSSVKCWGSNVNYQLGLGSTATSTATVTSVD